MSQEALQAGREWERHVVWSTAQLQTATRQLFLFSLLRVLFGQI